MVRPVELQDVFAKTQAAERITQLQKAQPENQQRQAAAETAQKAQTQQRKPVKSTHADEVILHKEKDQKEKNQKKKDGEGDGTGTEETVETVDSDESSPSDTETAKDHTPDDPESAGLDIVV